MMINDAFSAAAEAVFDPSGTPEKAERLLDLVGTMTVIHNTIMDGNKQITEVHHVEGTTNIDWEIR